MVVRAATPRRGDVKPSTQIASGNGGSGSRTLHAPTDRVLIAAAKLRVTTDRKLGLQTPEWVMELAGKDEDGRDSEGCI